MPQHPQEPHLFTVRVDGDIVAAVRANSKAEARDYWLGKHVVIERPTPIQAFRIGALLFDAGDVENAKPEYAELDRIQLPLLGEGSGEPGGYVNPEDPRDA